MLKEHNSKEIIIFDLCGVLMQWSPLKAYKHIIADKQRLNFFIKNVMNLDFVIAFDEGRSLTEAIKKRQKEFPDFTQELAIYPSLRKKMYKGEIKGSVQIIRDLKKIGLKLYLLSNCGHDNIPLIEELFKPLYLFDGIVFSGQAKIAKPNPKIFDYFFTKYNLSKEQSLFIDDNPLNILSAQNIGLDGIVFKTPSQLRRELRSWNIPIRSFPIPFL